jgi:hypothetical protein
MKTLEIVVLSILGIIALLLVIALFLKKEFKISREITIQKPKQVVFDYIKLLTNQNNFSVWALTDPVMKKEFKGIDGTVGFVSAWDSQVKNVGKGEQEIIGMAEGERIDYELRFFKPMKATNYASMITTTEPDKSTRVIWVFEGKMKYPSNLSMLFMNLDAMLGKDLAQGLSNLKQLLEMK